MRLLHAVSVLVLAGVHASACGQGAGVVSWDSCRTGQVRPDPAEGLSAEEGQGRTAQRTPEIATTKQAVFLRNKYCEETHTTSEEMTIIYEKSFVAHCGAFLGAS